MQRSLFEDELTESSTVAKYELGTLREGANGKMYRYVQNIDVASADGYALTAGSATDPNIVSADRSGGSAINSIPRGVGIGAIAVDSYGWVQVSGIHTSVLSDGGVAEGEAVVAHATTDGGVDSAAVGSTDTITNHQSFGLAMADDTTSRVTALISVL